MKRIERLARLVMLGVLVFEFVALMTRYEWLHAALVFSILIVFALPLTLPRRQAALVPLEVQFFFSLFIFATLFLGEVHDFYNRIWWWDLALHLTAGFLLGLLGFLIVYLMNEANGVDVHMRPAFIALFAFMFAVSLGTLWEIFEFAMDQNFGLTMQKPMLGDPSGLTDTMWDLIVDALGALGAVILGWVYIRRAKLHGVDNWLRRFVDRHPRLFSATSELGKGEGSES